MKRTLLLLLALVAAASPLYAQRQTLTLTVREGAASKALTLGVDPAATNGLDAALGEAELPPMPPSGVFEARFVPPGDSVAIGQGSYIDYRGRTTATATQRLHQVRIQRADGGTVTVEWSFPAGVTARAQDLFGGVVLNHEMTTRTGSFQISSSAIDQVRVLVSYPTPVAAADDAAAAGWGFEVRPSLARAAASVRVRGVGAATVSVHDVLGREAFRAAVVGDGREQVVALPVASLRAGAYTVRLATDRGVFVQRLVVKR